MAGQKKVKIDRAVLEALVGCAIKRAEFFYEEADRHTRQHSPDIAATCERSGDTIADLVDQAGALVGLPPYQRPVTLPQW